VQKQVEQVKQFHTSTDQPVSALTDVGFGKLRGKLQVEEALELKQAIEDNNMVEIADAVIDSLYVAIGAAVAYGFSDKLDELFDAVHKSNMSKLDPATGKAIYREDGKILKGPDFKPPTDDIKRILGLTQ
jgi:predicted HAD superfamily Cof-like phosphohydrolase